MKMNNIAPLVDWKMAQTINSYALLTYHRMFIYEKQSIKRKLSSVMQTIKRQRCLVYHWVNTDESDDQLGLLNRIEENETEYTQDELDKNKNNQLM